MLAFPSRPIWFHFLPVKMTFFFLPLTVLITVFLSGSTIRLLRMYYRGNNQTYMQDYFPLKMHQVFRLKKFPSSVPPQTNFPWTQAVSLGICSALACELCFSCSHFSQALSITATFTPSPPWCSPKKCFIVISVMSTFLVPEANLASLWGYKWRHFPI